MGVLTKPIKTSETSGAGVRRDPQAYVERPRANAAAGRSPTPTRRRQSHDLIGDERRERSSRRRRGRRRSNCCRTSRSIASCSSRICRDMSLAEFVDELIEPATARPSCRLIVYAANEPAQRAKAAAASGSQSQPAAQATSLARAAARQTALFLHRPLRQAARRASGRCSSSCTTPTRCWPARRC